MTDYGEEIAAILQNCLQDIRAGHDLIIKKQFLALLDRARADARLDEVYTGIKSHLAIRNDPDTDVHTMVKIEKIADKRLTTLTSRLPDKADEGELI